MKNLKNFIVVLIIILILIIGIIGVSEYKTKSKEKNEIDNNIQIEEKPEIIRVDNITMFFTVENCVNKYIMYLCSQDTDIIFNLLDETYKTELNVNKANVLQHVEKMDSFYSFVAKDMYYEKNGDLQKYYVTGEITEEGHFDSLTEANVIKFNITVILDMSNNTFTVIPFGYGGMYYEENHN